jgi:dihydropyrimidinase
MTILIQSGTVVTAAESFPADILVEEERIAAIGLNLSAPGAEVIDAKDKLIFPGGVDPHTHFALPMFGTISSDDAYSGHKAAAFGGTTTVIDFVPLDAPSLSESIDLWHLKTDDRAVVDYGFHINITHLDKTIASELPRLPEQGISSIKVFTAYNNRLRLADDDIYRVMRVAGESGLLTLLHAENGDIIEMLVSEALSAGHTSPEWHARTRPAWGAVEATLRGIAISAQAGAPLYLVHLNAGGEVDMLDYGRLMGLRVMGETCPQYLFFTENELKRPDGEKWVCSPPLRQAEDNARLWQGVQEGAIQVIATDHCPFFYDGTHPIIYEGVEIAIPGKELGKHNFTLIPNGLPGVGDRLPILWTYGVMTGKINANQFVAITSTNPAKIFGLYPRKGAIIPGADADLVIWDPNKKLTYGIAHAHHRTDYNIFEGWEITGIPEKVFLRGRLLVDEGRWHGRPGMGRFLYRSPGAIL